MTLPVTFGVGPQRFHKNNTLGYAKGFLNRFNGLFLPLDMASIYRYNTLVSNLEKQAS
jgi:hypothetical protein